MGEPNWITAKQAARMYGRSDATVRRMCQRGEIPGARLVGTGHGQWRIPLAAVQRQVELRLSGDTLGVSPAELAHLERASAQWQALLQTRSPAHRPPGSQLAADDMQRILVRLRHGMANREELFALHNASHEFQRWWEAHGEDPGAELRREWCLMLQRVLNVALPCVSTDARW